MKVLVAYATRHGATQGIAERIGETLERHGLEVTVAPADRVEAPETYDAYVIGSAAYYFHWLKEAKHFVDRHHVLLAERPVWLFSSGPVGTERVDAKGQDVVAGAMPKEFLTYPNQIHPRDEHVFFGAYDPDAPPSGLLEGFFARMVPAVRNALPAGDFRDWAEIEAWADRIATELLETKVAVTV